MKAIVAEKVGPPAVLKVVERAIPEPKPGWVLIKVKAFGLNRSEMFTRQGQSPSVKFPIVLGIECVGIVEKGTTNKFAKGQQVCAIMGGMGREFDGGYQEYVCVPESIVLPFESTLDWSVLGALPEMFQTAIGSLQLGLNLHREDTLLIRGGTSSIGMAATQLAKTMGATVIATTRNSSKMQVMKDNGVDRVLIDDGLLSSQVKAIYPEGVDKVLELIGATTLKDSLQCAKAGGIVCMTGILGNQWVLKDFEPMGDIPSTVRLTSYMGESANLSAVLFREFIKQVEDGSIKIRIDTVFGMDDIVAAHGYMEANKAKGKLVVETGL